MEEKNDHPPKLYVSLECHLVGKEYIHTKRNVNFIHVMLYKNTCRWVLSEENITDVSTARGEPVKFLLI